MPLLTPTADAGITYQQSDSGSLVINLNLTPFPFGTTQDINIVTGAGRLEQDIIRWFLTPQGANAFDTNFGNPLFSLLGRASADQALVASLVQQCEDYFLQRQNIEAAQGYLSIDEQVDHFDPPTITFDGQGSANIQIPVVSRSGNTSQIIVPTTVTVSP